MASTALQDRARSRPHLTVVSSSDRDDIIDRDPDSVRRYRLWHYPAGRKSPGEQMRWRYYTDMRRAHMGALIEARWAEVGTTVEVFDIHRPGKTLGQYTRRINDIHFLGE